MCSKDACKRRWTVRKICNFPNRLHHHQILEQQPHPVKLLPHQNRTPESEPHSKKKVCRSPHPAIEEDLCKTAQQKKERKSFVQDKVVKETSFPSSHSAAAALENLLLQISQHQKTTTIITYLRNNSRRLPKKAGKAHKTLNPNPEFRSLDTSSSVRRQRPALDVVDGSSTEVQVQDFLVMRGRRK